MRHAAREWEVIYYAWNLPDMKTKCADAFKVADKNTKTDKSVWKNTGII